MKQKSTIKAILEALDSQDLQGETPLIFALEPNLIPDAMTALRDYRKVFAPVIPGLSDTSQIHAAYESMRQANRHANEGKPVILLLVECETAQQFRDALAPLPIRHSSDWRSLW
jgi:hypothetical protein